jgi:hypothetical protein
MNTASVLIDPIAIRTGRRRSGRQRHPLAERDRREDNDRRDEDRDGPAQKITCRRLAA